MLEAPGEAAAPRSDSAFEGVSACMRRLRSVRATSDHLRKRSRAVGRAVRADRRPKRGRSWPSCCDAERCADGSEAGKASVVCRCRAVRYERARGTQSRERYRRPSRLLQLRREDRESISVERVKTREGIAAAPRSCNAGKRAQRGHRPESTWSDAVEVSGAAKKIRFCCFEARGGSSQTNRAKRKHIAKRSAPPKGRASPRLLPWLWLFSLDLCG